MHSLSKPLISIILNCYNGETYLKEALKSVENQTYKNWELIFWDNQSFDKSKKIFFSFANKKFKYFKSKKHTSLYKARNMAIKKTKGKFISFIDADDTWEKDKLSIQIKKFRDKNVGVVYGNLWLQRDLSKKKRKHINYKLPQGYIFSDLINNYYVGILTSMIKKDYLKKLKLIFNNKYNIIGDYDLFLRLSKICKFKAIQKPIATYRLHKNNFSNLNRNLEVLEFKDWLRTNELKLEHKHYDIIKKKILQLEFVKLKIKDSNCKSFLFFFKFINKIFSLKNILILILPRFILKKIMWFHQ